MLMPERHFFVKKFQKFCLFSLSLGTLQEFLTERSDKVWELIAPLHSPGQELSNALIFMLIGAILTEIWPFKVQVLQRTSTAV